MSLQLWKLWALHKGQECWFPLVIERGEEEEEEGNKGEKKERERERERERKNKLNHSPGTHQAPEGRCKQRGQRRCKGEGQRRGMSDPPHTSPQENTERVNLRPRTIASLD